MSIFEEHRVFNIHKDTSTVQFRHDGQKILCSMGDIYSLTCLCSNIYSLRKHAYSNTLRILPPKKKKIFR